MPTNENLTALDSNAVYAYVAASKATITLQNTLTNKHYTYKITAPGKTPFDREESAILFVSLLTGPDNESSYTYIGVLDRSTGVFRTTAKSKLPITSVPVAGFAWLVRQLNAGTLEAHSNVKVFHHNHCGRCGRKLTHPESITTGLGPECSKRV
jgi:hypothetical protein